MISAPVPVRFTEAERAKFRPLALAIINKKQTETAVESHLGADYSRFKPYFTQFKAELVATKRAQAAQQPTSSSSSAGQMVPRAEPSSSTLRDDEFEGDADARQATLHALLSQRGETLDVISDLLAQRQRLQMSKDAREQRSAESREFYATAALHCVDQITVGDNRVKPK